MGVAKILYDFLTTTRNHTGSTGIKVVAGTNFHQMTIEFAKMIGSATGPQNVYLGFAAIVLAFCFPVIVLCSPYLIWPHMPMFTIVGVFHLLTK